MIGGVGAALLGVAGSTASDLRDARDGTPWSPARMDDYDSATSMRAIGGALVGVGATALVIGLALWIADVAGGDDHGMDERGR